jgi:2-polyprenyl-6-methoxyphenol hydroxylase-like FAD-dependent oxidoreductase
VTDTIESNDCDVLIAGAGPIGQILALLLAQQGLRVTVVERWEQPYPLPRAVALSHDNLRVLHQLGLREELAPLLEPWGEEGHVFKLTDASGQTLAESTFSLESASGFAHMSSFSQPDLERLLEQRVRVNPLIELRRGFSIEALSEDAAQGVTGTIRPHNGLALIPGGEPEYIRAAYVVGCDGSNSTVRSLLGTEMTDLDFSHDWLVVDVIPHTPPDWLPYACQHLDPARSTTLVPSGPGRRRWEFMVMPDDDQDNVDTDENSWRLLKAWGIHPGNAELVRHARYTFRGRWANQWRQGRVLLAGDAAHQMPPFMGQGINSGIRDAASLAWRLALLIRGKGSDSLLDDYSTERSAHVAQIIEQTVFIGRMFCATDPKECAERDAMIKSMGSLDIQDASENWRLQGGTVREDGIGGTLSVQARVGTGERTALLDEMVPPPGFLLLGRDRDPGELLSATQRTAWTKLQGRSVHFGPGGLTDAEGKYAAWFDRLDTEVVLVRPDFQVFGGARTPQDADDLVNDLIQLVLGQPVSPEKE